MYRVDKLRVTDFAVRVPPVRQRLPARKGVKRWKVEATAGITIVAGIWGMPEQVPVRSSKAGAVVDGAVVDVLDQVLVEITADDLRPGQGAP